MKLKILLSVLTLVSQQIVIEGQQSIYNSQCDQFNYCNNHGYCANGAIWCICNPQYTGVNCSECAPGYFSYPVCYSCKTYCQNGGVCINNTCVCPRNATDLLCSNCAPNSNGQYCNQDPIGFSVITNEPVYDIGGSSITILGAHLNKNDSGGASALCRFASYAFWYFGYYSTQDVYYSSSGRMVNDSALVCVTPTMHPSSYNISFSLDNGTNWFSDGYSNELSRLTLEVLAYCPTRLNKCSMNGVCQYGNCSCSLGFAGEKCDRCDDDYFDYPYCISCSQFCKNSSACVNGTCVCNAPYSGSRCTDCPQEYNGKGCLRIPIILSVTPQLVYDVGGSNLTVTISNFDQNTTNALCKFEADSFSIGWSDISCGYMINRTTVNCLVPRMNASWRRLSISMSNGIIWINSSLYIQVNGTCPRKCYLGRCNFGQCICNTNIAGESCSSCALGYYQYPYCYSCSICQSNNGTCDQISDSCICGDPLRFTGISCNECQPNYYGPNCTNHTQLLSVLPRTVTDLSIINGTNISLIGNNLYFASLSNVICKFEGSSAMWIVPAVNVNSSAAVCILSNGTQRDYVSASLSLDNGTTWVDKLNVWWIYSIFIDGACPTNGACSYGRCSYGQCICSPNYAGILCDQCANGYFDYPACYACSSTCSNNGTCVNGTCLCTERFTGKFCTECQPHYYGSQCLQITVVLSVTPSRVPDVGGVYLTVIGEHFDDNSTAVLCQFRLSTYPFHVQISSGSIINRTALSCLAPRIQSSTYELYISTDNGTSWTSSYVYLLVETSCPNGSNSCNLGSCSFGGCICNNYSTGSTCSSCAVGYYNFPNCYPCYYCEQNNGTCDHTSDKCICGDPTRFTGTFCNLCLQNSYARNCFNNYQSGNFSSTCDFPTSSAVIINSTSMTPFMETTEMTSSHQSTSMSPQTSMTSLYQSISTNPQTAITSPYQSTSMNSQTSMALPTTTIPTILTNFYIQFTLSSLVVDRNQTAYQLSIELVAIFTSSLGIYSNQINISVTIALSRILPSAKAQVRLFNSALESAESLLIRIRQQLADPKSLLKNHQITSQLTDQSISDLRNIYVCNRTEQETPCQTSSATQSKWTNSQTTLLLATIIPCIVGAILIGIIIFLVIRYLRQKSEKSSKYKLSGLDNPTTTF